jgi:hypothetical protein
MIIDEKATPEQRLALQAFAKRMAGDLWQHVVKVDYAPVDFTLEGDVHGRKAPLTAGTIAAIQTRAMKDSDHICHNERSTPAADQDRARDAAGDSGA